MELVRIVATFSSYRLIFALFVYNVLVKYKFPTLALVSYGVEATADSSFEFTCRTSSCRNVIILFVLKYLCRFVAVKKVAVDCICNSFS